MIRGQRGSLLIELAIVLSIVLAALPVVVPPLITAATLYSQSLSVQRTVENIVFESRVHYSERVLTTRCLSQSALSMSDISLPDNDGYAGYQVRYRPGAQSKSQPLGFEVEVTPNAQIKLEELSRYLTPERYTNTSLIFYFPLEYQLPDWSGWNTTTGCLQTPP